MTLLVFRLLDLRNRSSYIDSLHDLLYISACVFHSSGFVLTPGNWWVTDNQNKHKKEEGDTRLPPIPRGLSVLRCPVGATVPSAYNELAELAFRVSEAGIGHVGC